MENPQLYNSANIYVFIEYINTYYPEINISEVLEYASITELEISDNAQWFTQEQIDRFYEILERKTGNPNLAREAGRFTVQSKSSDMLRQYTSGFVTPSVAYWMIGKIASTVSRHISIKTKYITGNKILITATPKEGITEKPYQCENRIGLFEALAKYFTNEYAQVEHDECLHKQASSCKYIVSWKKTPATIWKIISRYSSLLGAILIVVLLFLMPFKSWAIYALIIFLGSALTFLVSEKLTNRDLSISV